MKIKVRAKLCLPKSMTALSLKRLYLLYFHISFLLQDQSFMLSVCAASEVNREHIHISEVMEHHPGAPRLPPDSLGGSQPASNATNKLFLFKHNILFQKDRTGLANP